MKKGRRRVYRHITHCIDCQKEVIVYYTAADFRDPPVILRCKYCNAHYSYTPEEDYYIRPLETQIASLHCVNCGALLKDSLVETHKNIQVCDHEFSLDDDFAGHQIPPDSETVIIDVNLIYSE